MSHDPLGVEELTPVILRPPIPTLVVKSEWEQPLSAILAYLGYTIDDVVSSRRVAKEVRLFWRVYSAGKRQLLAAPATVSE